MSPFDRYLRPLSVSGYLSAPLKVHCFILLCSLVVIPVHAQDDVGQLHEDALKNYQQGNLSEAVIHLKNVLQVAPEHLPSRLLMAEVLIEQGNGAAAEVELEYVQSKGVSASQLLPFFAESYLLQDKYREVLEITKPANRGKQLEGKLAYFRGRAHMGLHQLSSAYREFDRAVRLQPRLKEAKLGKAQVLIKRDQVDQASLIVDELLKSRSASANTWMVQANIQRLRGDFSGSLTSLNRALTREPGHLVARLARAGLLMRKGQPEKAERDVDFILEEIPLEPRAKYLKAIIRASKGDSRSAAEKVGEVMTTLKAVPEQVMNNNPSYLYLAGKTSYKLGAYDAAKSFLNKYLKVLPNDLDSTRTIAIIELRVGRPGVARTLLSKLNAIYPKHPEVLSLLGHAYMDLSNYEQAMHYFERVVEISPGSDIALTNLARSKMALGKLDEAVSLLLQARTGDAGQIELNLLLADAYTKSRRYPDAINIYKQLVESSPGISRFAQLYGATLGLNGDLEGAKKWFKRALELDPSNSQAIIHLARMYLVQGEPEKSISYLEGKIAENSGNYVLMVELAKTYSLLKNSDSALMWYNKAYVENNNTHLTLDGLIDEMVRTGALPEAAAIVDQFIGRNPTDAKAHTMMGNLHRLMNEPQKAIESYAAASNFAVNVSKALMKLANAQASNGDREGAINSLKKSIAWDESYLAGYISLVKLVIADGDKEYALRLISSISRLSPNTPVAHILSGELHSALEEYAEAETAYKKALDMGDNLKALSGLYGTYKNQGRESVIISRLEDWLNRSSNNLPVNLMLADAYLNAGRQNDSKVAYQNLLKLYPKSPIVLNNAADAYYTMGMEKSALELAKRAVKLAPKNVNYMDTLGWIESRMGNHKAALKVFREALAYDFTNPDVKYHLAITLDRLDRRGEATKLLMELVESDRPYADIAQAELLLDKWQGKSSTGGAQ